MKSRERLLVLAPLLERPSRTILAILGVACGAALYVAITIINAATLDHFAGTVEAMSGKATVSVVGGESGFPEETLDRVAAVPGVARVAPMVQARARTTHGQTVVVLGVDMLREPAVRAYQTEDVLDDPLEFLNDPNSILVTRAFAAEQHLAVGSHFPLGTKTFVVRGILADAGAARAFGGRVAFMDIDAARESFGKQGRTDRLDVVAEKDADVGAALAQAVGPGLRVERPAEQTASFRKMIASYQHVLDGLARLALVIAVFLVMSTMATNVSERRKEIGVLRAIGATRGTIVAAFVAQSAFLGLLGAMLGLPLGRAVAPLLVAAVSRSVELTYSVPIDVSSLHLGARVAVVTLVAGLAAGILGGLGPAYRASTVPCVEALRPKDVDITPRRSAWGRRALGFVLLVYVGVASALELDWRAPALHDSTLTVAYVGGALLAPWLSAVALRVIARVLGPFARTAWAKLAIASVTEKGARGAGTTTLSAALMLVFLMTATHASFKGTLDSANAKMLSADVWVSRDPMFLMSGDSEALPVEVKAAIDAVPGIDTASYAGAYGQRVVKTQHEGRTIVLKAWDRIPRDRAPIVMMDGDAERMFDDEPTALVSENFAAHFGKRRGDRLVLATPSGSVAFRVAGVVVELASPEGTVYVSREQYIRFWRDPSITVFFAFATERPDVVRDRVDAAVGKRFDVVTSSTPEVRAFSQKILDDAFAYTRAIEIAALLVGMLAFVSAVLVSTLERKRELAVWRAIGMSRTQLASMLLTEMALLGTAASVTSLVLGTYMAHVWLGGALTHDVGWPIVVTVPLAAVVATVVLGVVVGMIAGAFGARRATGIELREALAYE